MESPILLTLQSTTVIQPESLKLSMTLKPVLIHRVVALELKAIRIYVSVLVIIMGVSVTYKLQFIAILN